MTRRQFLILIVPLLAVLLGFVALSVTERVGRIGVPPWDEGFSYRVRRTFAREFVGGVLDQRLNEEAYFNALNAYIQTFDQYAEVVPPWDLAERRERSSGQYFGIGVRILAPQAEGPLAAVRITGICPDGPAQRAGLVIGDEIIGVEGRSLEEIAPEGDQRRLEGLIRGERHTKVRIRARREDGREREFDVVRDSIPHGSVFGVRMLDPERGIGYARISNFHVTTARSLRENLDRLEKQGLKSLVLDLRNDTGGLLPQAIEVADLFLERGVIVSVRGRDPEFSEVYSARKPGTIKAIPLAVLLNRFSASASEVLAGALQDHRRAAIVGERSYGKFLVQTVEELETKFGPALFKRTTAIYETPSGHHYPRSGPRVRFDPLAGIDPDLMVPMEEADERRMAELFYEETFTDWNPAQKVDYGSYVDEPLAAAVAILRGEVFNPKMTEVRDAGE